MYTHTHTHTHTCIHIHIHIYRTSFSRAGRAAPGIHII